MDQRRSSTPYPAHPDGTTELLVQHDTLFGFPSLARLVRTDHTRDIPEGATLFLYTDGLVEHHASRDIDSGIDALLDLLRTIHARPVQDIVDTVVDTLASDAPDDVVALAIRFKHSPTTGGSVPIRGQGVNSNAPDTPSRYRSLSRLRGSSSLSGIRYRIDALSGGTCS